MNDFTKVVRVGNAGHGDIYCKVEWKGGRLSITGVEGPMKNGDCLGGCGQIRDRVKSLAETFGTMEEGWDANLAMQFVAVWDRWHLNDLTTGSPAQSEFLRRNPLKVKYPESHYEEACRVLAAVGLHPDASYPGKGKDGYRYGEAWLREEVPDEVLEFLAGLPETTKTPAWV